MGRVPPDKLQKELEQQEKEQGNPWEEDPIESFTTADDAMEDVVGNKLERGETLADEVEDDEEDIKTFDTENEEPLEPLGPDDE